MLPQYFGMSEAQFVLAFVRPFPERHCGDFGARLLCAISTMDMLIEQVQCPFCEQDAMVVI